MLRKCKREDGSRLHKGTIELFNGNKARKVKTVYPLITERFTYSKLSMVTLVLKITHAGLCTQPLEYVKEKNNDDGDDGSRKSVAQATDEQY